MAGKCCLAVSCLLIAGAAAGEGVRDQVVERSRASLKKALKSGRRVVVSMSVGPTRTAAVVVSSDDESLSVRVRGSRLLLKWTNLSDADLYSLAAGVLDEGVEKHRLLAEFCMEAGLTDRAEREFEKVEELGGGKSPEAERLRREVEKKRAEIRESLARARFERIQALVKSNEAKKKKSAARALRTLMRDFADTEFVAARRAEWEELAKELTAKPGSAAILNIPPNTTGKPLTVWWERDPRINQHLAVNNALDEAAVCWAGRFPPWLGWKGEPPHDNYFEVRTISQEDGLVVVFMVGDFHYVRARDAPAEQADAVYVYVDARGNGGSRPGPDDLVFTVPVGTTYRFGGSGGRKAFRGTGRGWSRLRELDLGRRVPGPQAAGGSDQGGPWSWQHHSAYFFTDNPSPYGGYDAAIIISWEALGFRPSEEKEFGIAFMVADREPGIPDGLYDPPPEPKDEKERRKRLLERAKELAETLPLPAPDPHAVLRPVTDESRGDGDIAPEAGSRRTGKRAYYVYPFRGEHPSWRRWDPRTKTIYHSWPPNMSPLRPETWATARFRRAEIGEVEIPPGRRQQLTAAGTTFTGWGVDSSTNYREPHLIVHPELYPVHMRDYGCKAFLRFDLSKLRGVPGKAFIEIRNFGGDGGDWGDTGPSLLSFFLLEGQWWPETLTQSHPFQPLPIYNGQHKLWIPRMHDKTPPEVPRTWDVTDILHEALRRKKRTLDVALYGPDTDMDTGKYFRPGPKLILVY